MRAGGERRVLVVHAVPATPVAGMKTTPAGILLAAAAAPRPLSLFSKCLVERCVCQNPRCFPLFFWGFPSLICFVLFCFVLFWNPAAAADYLQNRQLVVNYPLQLSEPVSP
jgi:hypothetical protein